MANTKRTIYELDKDFVYSTVGLAALTALCAIVGPSRETCAAFCDTMEKFTRAHRDNLVGPRQLFEHLLGGRDDTPTPETETKE